MQNRFPAILTIALACAMLLSLRAASGSGALAAFTVVGDAILTALDGRAGNAARALTLIGERRLGNCLICHSLSKSDELFQGEIGPALDGVGGRLSAGQIRLRIVDASRLNPTTPMPPYYRVEDLVNVASEYKGRPVLDAQQIEDIVTYLASLKE
jgi:L-cysteine S-thiosulfotransferase